jgi:large subunit ribosomal protein L3
MSGLIGIKCGTSRLGNAAGGVDQVTIIKVFPNYVTEQKTSEKHGYSALQLASVPNEKVKSSGKQNKGMFEKLNIAPQKCIKEFPFSNDAVEQHQVGSPLGVELLNVDCTVSVTGTSLGKGFAGCVKRWNFGMQRATHGNSLSHRAPGSIGQCQDPGRVIKGKKMAGRLGGVRRTMKGLTVLRIDQEEGLLIVKGSVPGYEGSVVYVREQVKAKAKS